MPAANRKDLLHFSSFLKTLLGPGSVELKNSLKSERLMTLLLTFRNEIKERGGLEHLVSNNIFKKAVNDFCNKYEIPLFGCLETTAEYYFQRYV